MTTASLNKNTVGFEEGNDSIVIVQDHADIPGGRSLKVDGYTDEMIPSGSLIVKETATGEYKPLKISGERTYETLPEGHEYVGVLKATIPTRKPMAAILIHGVINEAASPAVVPADAKTALNNITFLYGK